MTEKAVPRAGAYFTGKCLYMAKPVSSAISNDDDGLLDVVVVLTPRAALFLSISLYSMFRAVCMSRFWRK